MMWEFGLIIAATALATALLGNWIIAKATPVRRVNWTPLEDMEERTVFLFDDTELVDATPEAHALLRAGPDQLQGWTRLSVALERWFPGCAEQMNTLRETTQFTMQSVDGTSELRAEWRGGLTRVVVTEPEDTRPAEELDGVGFRALSDELATLRAALDKAPVLVWRETESGTVDWANTAYFDLARRLGTASETDQISWPLPKLFPLQLADGETARNRRMSLTLPDEETPLWFELHSVPVGDHTMIHAMPVDRLVRTEANLREFLQTLTKTFAHLPTGLAVFDRARRLALFNPALTDLSGLEPQFLSAHPTLYEFLDKLREKQRMPEPKDYKSWRRQIGEMEAAAAHGTHQETWSLPTGQTFRVTGRPHPEGAVAFLFEDISAEISATRRFRAELEMSQTILDSLDEAIAVFSSAGTLIQSNTAYVRLWGIETDRILSEVTLQEALHLWSDQCNSSDGWRDLRDHAVRTHRRARWHGMFVLKDGRKLACNLAPLNGNACRVSFSVLPRLETAQMLDTWPNLTTAAAE